MSALAHEAGIATGRLSLLIATAALHAVVIAGLMTVRMITSADSGPSPIKSWIDLEKPLPMRALEQEPIVTRQWTPTPTPLPLPREIESVQASEPILAMGPQDQALGRTSNPDPVAMPTTPPGYRATRPTDEFYPAASIRAEEHGVAVVRVCISAQGELVERPRISTTSGYSRLDGAAIRWAMEGARFTPATRNGEPVADCKNLRVNFTLKGN